VLRLILFDLRSDARLSYDDLKDLVDTEAARLCYVKLERLVSRAVEVDGSKARVAPLSAFIPATWHDESYLWHPGFTGLRLENREFSFHIATPPGQATADRICDYRVALEFVGGGKDSW
jgi:hypothetical protein